MNIVHDHRCSGCGAPRQPGARYCRYCTEYVGVTRDLAVAVQELRPVPVVRAKPRAETVDTVTVGIGGWLVRAVCFSIVAVPVTLVLWSMISAMMLAGF